MTQYVPEPEPEDGAGPATDVTTGAHDDAVAVEAEDEDEAFLGETEPADDGDDVGPADDEVVDDADDDAEEYVLGHAGDEKYPVAAEVAEAYDGDAFGMLEEAYVEVPEPEDLPEAEGQARGETGDRH